MCPAYSRHWGWSSRETHLAPKSFIHSTSMAPPNPYLQDKANPKHAFKAVIS